MKTNQMDAKRYECGQVALLAVRVRMAAKLRRERRQAAEVTGAIRVHKEALDAEARALRIKHSKGAIAVKVSSN